MSIDRFWPQDENYTNDQGDLIFTRLEKYHLARHELLQAYDQYCQKRDFNEPLYELFSLGDPWDIVDAPHLKHIKEVAFDVLYKMGITSINPMPGEDYNYSFTIRAGSPKEHEIRDILIAYFGQLPVTKHSCERISDEYRHFCAQQLLDTPEHSEMKKRITHILDEPYFKELYDCYCMLQSWAYPVGEGDMQMMQRLHTYLMLDQENQTYFKWMYHNGWDVDALHSTHRTSRPYKKATLFFTDLCKEFNSDDLVVERVKITQIFWVQWISDLPKYMQDVLHELVLKKVFASILHDITRKGEVDFEWCYALIQQIARRPKESHPLGPFYDLVLWLILENPVLYSIYLRSSS